MDVKSLHTTTPNSKGIKTFKTSLRNFSRTMMATKVITTFLSLTLTLNNLVLNYLQIKGCVMGTICMLTSFGTFEIKKKLLRKVTNLTFYLDKHISRTVKGKS